MNRSSERAIIVIDDEESAKEQPVEKSVKREEEEEVPSSEVIVLQGKVEKLERDFQRACREARRAELRAEYAEKLLENKRGIIDGEEKMKMELEEMRIELDKALSQLEEARGRKKKVISENSELKRENADLKADMDKMRREHQMLSLHFENTKGLALNSIPIDDSMDGLSTVPIFTQFPKEPKVEQVEPKEEPADAAKIKREDSMDRMSTVPNFTEFPKEPKKETVETKKEPVAAVQTIPSDNQMSDIGDVMNLNEGNTSNNGVDAQMGVPIDSSLNEPSFDNDIADEPARTMSQSDLISEEISAKGKDSVVRLSRTEDGRLREMMMENFSIPKELVEPSMDDMTDVAGDNSHELMDSTDTIDVEKKRRPSRVSKEVKYMEFMEDSDEDEEPSVKKKKRSASEKNSGNTNPKCVLCETYPSTPLGYVGHLRRNHKSTLYANGIYLICSCGITVTCERSGLVGPVKHEEKCDALHYSLHKLDEISTDEKNVSSALSDSEKKKPRESKRSDTEMECIECEFRTNTVGTWLTHLRKKHSTNPTLAGLVLRCECGQECSAEHHSTVCDISNFTVIRKRDGLIRRLEDEKETPVCVLCEKHPKTASSYAVHLRAVHNTTLEANGIYLACECGFKVMSITSLKARAHTNKCGPRLFSLHKLEQN